MGQIEGDWPKRFDKQPHCPTRLRDRQQLPDGQKVKHLDPHVGRKGPWRDQFVANFGDQAHLQ
jgi:hypothetical protein